MTLEEISMKDLLVLHNKIADKPAGPKTFATRGKLVARIEAIAADKNIDVASFGRPQQPEATVPSTQPQAEAVESQDAQPETVKAPRGKGIGARTLCHDLESDGPGALTTREIHDLMRLQGQKRRD